jgi:hypothetical protein
MAGQDECDPYCGVRGCWLHLVINPLYNSTDHPAYPSTGQRFPELRSVSSELTTLQRGTWQHGKACVPHTHEDPPPYVSRTCQRMQSWLRPLSVPQVPS